MASAQPMPADGSPIPGLHTTGAIQEGQEPASPQPKPGVNGEAPAIAVQDNTSASIEDELRDLIAPTNEDAPPLHSSLSHHEDSTSGQFGTVQSDQDRAKENGDGGSHDRTGDSATGPEAIDDGPMATGVTSEAASGLPGSDLHHQQSPDEEVTGEAEWEADSSPYESSDSSSDETSSDDSDEEVDDHEYSMLTPQEQARILMQDAGSDDEGPSKGGKGGSGHVRSINEKPEEIIPKPNIEVTQDMAIAELGEVLAAVEGTVLVKAKISGEYQVLESGSLLCLKDRSVVGVVAETLGRVQEPLYTIRFTNNEAIKDAGLSEPGAAVFYVQQHSTFVFTQPLKSMKGSDASNVNDEEVGDDEIEFSDDEAEAEYKRQLKQKRQERRDARSGGNAPSRSCNAGNDQPADRARSLYDDTPEINYDDVDTNDDDGYTPLARPANLHELLRKTQAPGEIRPGASASGSYRGRGDRHHRGSRGRGRGDRGHGGRGVRVDYSSGMRNQAGHHTSGSPQGGRPPIPSWTPNSQFHPAPSLPAGFQMLSRQQTQPMPIPHAPSLSPQNSQQPYFSPSPISPLPSTQFHWPVPPQQNTSTFQIPPPPSGSHTHATSYNQTQPPYGQNIPNGQTHDNSAALAQVQAQLQMLQRYANNYQSQGPSQGR